MFRSASISIAILLSLASRESMAGFLINPSFEEGLFASPGDSNYNVFAPGVTGTIVYPGQDALTGWVVVLSPYDPDGLITAVPGFGLGLEWVNAEYGSFDGNRFLNLNRGGDLYKIGQSIGTTFGQEYDFTYYGLGGSLFYGATTEVAITGNSVLVMSDDTTTMSSDDLRGWQRFTTRFTADSSTTSISLTAKKYGADLGSGTFIDALSVTSANPVPVPPTVVAAAISYLLLFAGTRVTDRSVWAGLSRRSIAG